MKIHVYIKRLNCGLRLDVCAAREFIDLDCSKLEEQKSSRKCIGNCQNNANEGIFEKKLVISFLARIAFLGTKAS